MFVLPGTYQVRLTVGGRSFRQPVVVRMDPRVRTSTADLTLQLKLSKALDGAIRRLAAARADVNTRAASATGDAAAPLQAALRTLQDAFAPLQGLFESLQEADLRPTPAVEAAVTAALQRVDAALAEYKRPRRSVLDAVVRSEGPASAFADTRATQRGARPARGGGAPAH